MMEFYKRWVSGFFVVVFFIATTNLSLCLHDVGNLHLIPNKSLSCSSYAKDASISNSDDICIDITFNLDKNFTFSKNLVKTNSSFFESNIFESTKVFLSPKIKFESISLKNAPPDIVLGELYNNLVARLLI